MNEIELKEIIITELAQVAPLLSGGTLRVGLGQLGEVGPALDLVFQRLRPPAQRPR